MGVLQAGTLRAISALGRGLDSISDSLRQLHRQEAEFKVSCYCSPPPFRLSCTASMKANSATLASTNSLAPGYTAKHPPLAHQASWEGLYTLSPAEIASLGPRLGQHGQSIKAQLEANRTSLQSVLDALQRETLRLDVYFDSNAAFGQELHADGNTNMVSAEIVLQRGLFARAAISCLPH